MPLRRFEVPRRSVVSEAVRPKIGQVLLEAGRLSSADLEKGLAAQRTSRLRLGSTLVQLGLVTTDEVARALARQHGLPAALDRHLAGRDPALVARLPAEVARTLCALPVALSRGGDGLNLVVCLRDPTAPMVADIRAAARMPVIASVACELVLRRELDVAYPRTEDESFDIDVEEVSAPFPQLGQVSEMSLVELDDKYVVKEHMQAPTGPTAVPVIEKLAEKRQTGSHRIPDAPTPRSQVALSAMSVPAPGPGRVVRLDEAISELAHSDDPERVADIAIDCLRGLWKGGLVMQVKDREKLALGQHGYGGSVTEANVESIVVPLDQPSVMRTAHDDRRPFAGEATVSSTVQDRFLRLFSSIGSKTLSVAPVLVRNRPVALLFGIGPIGGLPETSAALATLAHAMGEAYLRIILASK